MLNPFTHRKVLKNGVPGKALIVTMGALDRGGGISFNLPMTLQVYVEGWVPYEVHEEWWVNARDTVALSGWIPVKVDPEERDKVAIDWDTLRETHARQEEARKQALAASGPVPDIDALGGLGGLGPNVTVQVHEIDLTPSAPAAPPDDDPIARLERLAALKASGVLTDEEFQQQKRRILSES